MKLERIGQKVENFIHGITKALEVVAIVVLILLGLFTTIDVIGRYLLRRPVPGDFDIVQVFLLVLVYAGFAYCAFADGNIRVDIIYSRFPRRVKSSLDIISSLGAATVVGCLVWRHGFRASIMYMGQLGDKLISFEVPWPWWPFIAFAAIGSAVLFLEFFLWFCHSLRDTIIRSPKDDVTDPKGEI